MCADSEKIVSALALLRETAAAIRERGEVPSGHLYEQLIGPVTLTEYQQIIDLLMRAGLVEKTDYQLLRWTGRGAGPKKKSEHCPSDIPSLT